MTTLIQRTDLPADDLPVEGWLAEPTMADELQLADEPQLGAGRQPRATPRADSDIAAEIARYLHRGLNVADGEVEVTVEDGVVLLAGQLSRQMFVHRLLERVNGIDGVVSVTHRLTARYNDAVVPFAWGF